ncbi:cinnamyl-alcohol dehydrogenase [Trifolium repens]|nr:cinnamyl-alcohol dehydrogenase [Trifolium repens]
MATTQPEFEHPNKAFGLAARDPSGLLSPFNFSRRETGEKDVAFKVLYCGICHSDLHMVKNEWGMSTYPLVPGHEIAGIVTEVGSKVQKFKVGDRVGVGCMVDSCRTCQNCEDNLENYCPQYTLTYGAKHSDGTITYGGYSDSMVANEHFVVRIPDNLPLEAAAPLLCAGITVYSPLKYFGLDKPGLHIGVVGLGGLGYMAVKFAKAFGANVTVISTSPNKENEAIEHLGADTFLISRDQDKMQATVGTLDFIIDTVSAAHPLLPLIGLLKSNGKLDDMEHFGDVGSLDDNVESFLSQDDGDGKNLFGTLKWNPSEDAIDASKAFSFSEVSSIRKSNGKVVCYHFLSDGKLLASAGHDKKVVLWNIETLQTKSTPKENTVIITEVRFRSNSTQLATSSFDATVRL